MSALALKRDKRKKTKPKLSFGSSSAACINLPSKIQANFADLFALLKRQHPGFRQLHEELHSFLCYQDPVDDDDDYDCEYSTATVSPQGARNGLPSPAACKEVCSGQELEQLAAANDGNGPRGVRASSCRRTSYESAVEYKVEEKGKKGVSRRNDSSQAPSQPRCLSRGLQAMQLTFDVEVQTHGWDIAQCAELQLLVKKQNNENSELRERLASLQEDHTCEMQQLHLKNEKLRNMLLLGTSPSLLLPNEVTFVRMVQLD